MVNEELASVQLLTPHVDLGLPQPWISIIPCLHSLGGGSSRKFQLSGIIAWRLIASEGASLDLLSTELTAHAT